MFQPQRIIDDVSYLTNLSEDELTEVLLDNKYNKANLRELVRRIIEHNRSLERSLNFSIERHKETEKELSKLKNQLEELSKERYL